MVDYIAIISAELGIPLWILISVIIWEGVWKLIAMWKAAKNNSAIWFILLAIVNTVGILSILYIFGFSKMGKKIKTRKISKRKK